MSAGGPPPMERTALLLDLDGTLLDMAPTPESVVVPPGLIGTLRALRAHMNDALAIVTGRPIAAIDALMDGAPFAVSGEHGGALRRSPDAEVERPDLPAPPLAWLGRAAELEAAWPGTILERKARGFGVHYRLAPDAGPAIRDALAALVDGSADFALMRGHMLWEVRPRGADKGRAVRALMRQPPFAGRLPLFIGDDVTDLDGIRAARDLGGAGLFVPEVFAGPPGCRAWLTASAERGHWAPLP